MAFFFTNPRAAWAQRSPIEWRLLLALAAAIACAFYLSPLVVLVAICLFAALAMDGISKGMFLLAACLLFVLLNVAKQVDGDLVIYEQLQHYFAGRNPLVLLDSGELRAVSSTYRITEIGFYGPLWLLANLFGDHSAVLPISATLAIYTLTFAAVLQLARASGWNNRLTLVVLVFVFFAAINFTQTTHLIRQYVSASLAFVAFALLVREHERSALLAALAACTVHNGTALLVANFAVLALLFPAGRVHRLRGGGWAWRIIVAALMVGASFAVLILNDISVLVNDDENISFVHYAVAGGLFAAFRFYCGDRLHPRVLHYMSLAYGLIFALSAAFFLVGLRVLALRYFAYLEWLFGLVVAGLLCTVPRSRLGLHLLSRWTVCFASTAILLLRIHYSEWVYGLEQTELFAQSLLEVSYFVGH